MKKRAVVMMVMAFGVMLIASAALAGGMTKAKTTEALESQLGVRLTEPLPQNLKTGTTIAGTVLTADKFAGRGFSQAKRGEKVTLTVMDEKGKKFQVTHGNQTQSFTMTESGQITAGQ